MLCLGRSDGFRIRFDPMLAIQPAPSRETFVSANMPRFLAVVERQIVENPEEWRLWNHCLDEAGSGSRGYAWTVYGESSSSRCI